VFGYWGIEGNERKLGLVWQQELAQCKS